MATIQVLGNLSKKMENKEVGSTNVLEFSVVENQYNGPNEDKTGIWYTAKIWGKRGESALTVLQRDDVKQVLVSGTITYRTYNDKVYNEINVSEFTPIFSSGTGKSEAQEDDMPF